MRRCKCACWGLILTVASLIKTNWNFVTPRHGWSAAPSIAFLHLSHSLLVNLWCGHRNRFGNLHTVNSDASILQQMTRDEKRKRHEILIVQRYFHFLVLIFSEMEISIVLLFSLFLQMPFDLATAHYSLEQPGKVQNSPVQPINV